MILEQFSKNTSFSAFPFYLIFYLILIGNTSVFANPAMVVPHGETIQLMPFLDYYVDSSKGNDIEEIAALGDKAAFKPFELENLPREEGITWLRFILAPQTQDLRSGVYLLDMGQ